MFIRTDLGCKCFMQLQTHRVIFLCSSTGLNTNTDCLSTVTDNVVKWHVKKTASWMTLKINSKLVISNSNRSWNQSRVFFESLAAHIPPCFVPFLDAKLQQTCLFWTALETAPPFCYKTEKQRRRRKTTLIGSPLQPPKNSTIKVSNI